jgi:hypothetical protein
MSIELKAMGLKYLAWRTSACGVHVEGEETTRINGS